LKQNTDPHNCDVKILSILLVIKQITLEVFEIVFFTEVAAESASFPGWDRAAPFLEAACCSPESEGSNMTFGFGARLLSRLTTGGAAEGALDLTISQIQNEFKILRFLRVLNGQWWVRRLWLELTPLKFQRE
jgi:hypothetical protein